MNQNTSTIGNIFFWASKLWWLHKINDLVIQDYMSSHLEWNCTTCYFISHLTWPSKGRAVRPGYHRLLSLGRWPWLGWTTREASGTSWWRFLSSLLHLHGSLRRLKIFKLINWLVNSLGVQVQVTRTQNMKCHLWSERTNFFYNISSDHSQSEVFFPNFTFRFWECLMSLFDMWYFDSVYCIEEVDTKQFI